MDVFERVMTAELNTLQTQGFKDFSYHTAACIIKNNSKIDWGEEEPKIPLQKVFPERKKFKAETGNFQFTSQYKIGKHKENHQKSIKTKCSRQ